MDHDLASNFRNFCINQSHLFYFISSCFIVIALTFRLGLFRVSFCVWCKVWIRVYLFIYFCIWIPHGFRLFVETITFASLNFLYTFVKNYLSIYILNLFLQSLFCSTDLFFSQYHLILITTALK